MYDHTFSQRIITSLGVRPYIKWVVSLVIAYGYINLPHCNEGLYISELQRGGNFVSTANHWGWKPP